MLRKELTKDLRPGNDGVEEALHRPITATFTSPAGDTQHRHPASHAQHRLDNSAHATYVCLR